MSALSATEGEPENCRSPAMSAPPPAARLHDLDLEPLLREIAFVGRDEERAVIHRRHDVADLDVIEREGRR
jgi:hypothetical protein